MPKYTITLIDVEVGDDNAAKLAGLGAVSRIMSCGGDLRGLAIQDSNGRVINMGPEEIILNQNMLREAARLAIER